MVLLWDDLEFSNFSCFKLLMFLYFTNLTNEGDIL